MRKVHLSFVFAFAILLSFAQTQTGNSSSPSAKKNYRVDSAGVHTFVEQNPEFPGGDAALMQFLSGHIRYPEKEKLKKTEGKVLVRFVIKEDGSVGEVKISTSLGPSFDEEAVRVVKSLPKFIPGKQLGKPVKVYFNLPIVFKLN